MTIACRI